VFVCCGGWAAAQRGRAHARTHSHTHTRQHASHHRARNRTGPTGSEWCPYPVAAIHPPERQRDTRGKPVGFGSAPSRRGRGTPSAAPCWPRALSLAAPGCNANGFVPVSGCSSLEHRANQLVANQPNTKPAWLAPKPPSPTSDFLGPTGSLGDRGWRWRWIYRFTERRGLHNPRRTWVVQRFSCVVLIRLTSRFEPGRARVNMPDLPRVCE
jgi:hypothetical protein